MTMVDVKNRFGVEQLRNMGWGNAARPQLRPLKEVVYVHNFKVLFKVL